VTLQTTLAGLTEQYMQFTFLSTKSAADTVSWQLRPNDPRDRAALRSLVQTSPLTGYGAAVVSLDGTPLNAYPSESALPPATDPGFGPLRGDLLSGQPGLSDVMTVKGTPVVAFAVPITAGGQPLALLVTFADVRSWPLQGYDAKLHVGTRSQSYVVDRTGTIAASTTTSELGKRLPALGHLDRAKPAGFVAYRADKASWDMSYGPAGQGWTAVTVQPASTFSGAVDRSRQVQTLALASLLSLVVLLLVVFHHKRQHALARLAEERLYDPLTGLGQRGVFEMRVRAALARRARHHQPLAVLFCDVDAFKEINDRYGHNTGDQLLATIARRVSEAVRDTDMVARLGGDEFAVVMEEANAEEATRIAERIRRAVSESLTLNGREMVPSVSVGAAVLTEGESTLDELLHEADMAMYQAKRSGAGHQLLTIAGSAEAGLPRQRA
jgi:diguanylate cyclase (GGDEF)-like protein